LESRLETAAKLTVVAAPAGWGKTSLLSRWAAGASADRAVAWVSLDESDDEPVRFFSYVLTALRQVSDDIGPAALDALASGDGPMAQALPLLLNELAAASARHVLVLDDYHVITNADVHDGMEFLLSYLPSTLRIVLAGRADPPFALARMRVRGELAELRAQDLRFSGDESVALLSAVAATEVDAAAASAVTDRAEGWAAGLQLAGLALRQAVIAPVRGDDRHLFDYFTAEVFPALAAAQRDLLVRAAPLELLSGSLCDAALDVKGSAAVLAELERADLFVVALDRQRDWYRCHRLLREALGWSRGSEPDETTRDVLRRAAGWFADHDRIDDAVRHLQDAGDHAEAADRLVKGQLWFLDRGWAATYLALGERLPEAAVPPQLALFLAYAAGAGENRERARHWLDVCDRQIDADTVIEGWRSARAAEFSLRGLLATDPSDPAQAVAICEQGLALEGAHPVAEMAVGLAYGLAGRFSDATAILGKTWRMRGQGRWSSGVDLQVAGQLCLFLLALESPLDAVVAEAAAAADVAEREWGAAAAGPVISTIRLIEGRRHYQRGDLDSARARLERALHLAETAGRAVDTVLGLVFLADTELGGGNRAEARTALVRAREVVDNEPVPPFVRAWLDEAENRIGRVAVRTAASAGALFEELTDRELSILRMLPGTATQREIGAALFLSINTVKAYNKSLYRKLAVGGRPDAVRVARRLGLI
jgi:LuxR family maltose regulon positive regulatory protein